MTTITAAQFAMAFALCETPQASARPSAARPAATSSAAPPAAAAAAPTGAAAKPENKKCANPASSNDGRRRRERLPRARGRGAAPTNAPADAMMQKMHLPRGAIEQKMRAEGRSEADIAEFFGA